MKFPRVQALVDSIGSKFEHTIANLKDIVLFWRLLESKFHKAEKKFNSSGKYSEGMIQLVVACLSIPYSWVSLPFSLAKDLSRMGIFTKTLNRLLYTFGQGQYDPELIEYKIDLANMIFMAPLYILSLPWKIIEDICDMAQTLTNERIMKNTLDNIREIARLDSIKLYSELNKSIIWGFPVFLDSMVVEILKLPFSICLDIPSLIYEVVSLPWTIAAGIKSVWDRDTVVGNKQEVIREPSGFGCGLATEGDEKELNFTYDNYTRSFVPGYLPSASSSGDNQLTLAELPNGDTGDLTTEEMEQELARAAKLGYI